MDSTYAEAGTKVVLGKHVFKTDSRLSDNWDPQMDSFVGKMATIKEVSGIDDYGCVCCRVKEYGWVWRVENMILASDVPLLTPEQRAKLQIREEYG